MTDSEYDGLTTKLKKDYFMIPRLGVFYFLGGAVALLIALFGISMAKVYEYLRSEPAEIARRRIEEIRKEAETHLAAMGPGGYVRSGAQVSIMIPDKTYELANDTPHVKPTPNAKGSWIIVPD